MRAREHITCVHGLLAGHSVLPRAVALSDAAAGIPFTPSRHIREHPEMESAPE
jgi:hypothetical protein